MKKITITMFLIALLVVLPACSKTGATGQATANVQLFKSPNCGCCVGHASTLTSNDFDVEIIPTIDMASIKNKYNIPLSAQSCHTAIIEEYVVEGHVPMEAIEKLLTEKPDIDGIALPRMPAGSPGMPGAKTEPWTIYAIKDGQTSEFMVI